MVRCFLAISLSKSVKEKLQKIQQKLAQSKADVRWVRPDGIHLTLKFFGNIPEKKIEEIAKVVKEVVSHSVPLKLKVKGLGTFPSMKRPRVIWAGVTGDVKELIALQQKIEEALMKIGFEPEDRSFIPHLTLGRVKSNRHIEKLCQVIKDLSPETGNGWEEIKVDSLVLYQSILKPSGAIYVPLKTISLGKG